MRSVAFGIWVNVGSRDEAMPELAVVDEELAIAQYRRTNIVGKKIVLTAAEHAETFEIIGVIRSQKDGVNQIVGGILPQFAYVPYSTLGELRGDRTLSQIAVRCAENAAARSSGVSMR